MSKYAGNRQDYMSIETGARLDPQTTRKLIEAYRPVDVVSAEYQRRFIDLIDRAPQHFANRYNYDINLPGHFTAQAVVFNPEKRAIALMHHKKLNIWVGPGGHIDLEDESAEVAARREAAEEMGLKDLFLAEAAPFDLDIHGFPAKKDQPDHLHYDIRFLFTSTQAEFQPNEESLDVEWVPLAEYADRVGMWLPNSRLVRGIHARFGPV